jgi:hypothetical protein
MISTIVVITANEKINLIGATEIIVEINNAVGAPTIINWAKLFSAAHAAAMPLRQTTTVRMAGTIPNLISSAVAQKAGDKNFTLFLVRKTFLTFTLLLIAVVFITDSMMIILQNQN